MAITRQHELVYERLKSNYSETIEANKVLGDRALVVVGVGAAVAAFSGVDSQMPNGQLSASLLVGVIALGVSVIAALIVWFPFNSSLPGSVEIERLWDSIIDEEDAVAFANIIQDQVGALSNALFANWCKGIAFGCVVLAIGVEMVAVTVGAFQ